MRIFSLLIVYSFFTITSACFAGITLPWSTTYDCDEYTQGTDNLSCDGLSEWGGWSDACGNHEQITSAANNPIGEGGRGQRHWYGPGSNSNSGGLSVAFDDEPSEIWLRWYMRFPPSLKWDRINYDKLMYLYLAPRSVDAELIIEWNGSDGFTVAKQGMSNHDSPTGNWGWESVMGRPISDGGDGQWHYYEVHLKIDTNGSNGITEAWIDDTKVIDVHNVDFDGLTRGNTGFSHLTIGSNQEDVSNGCHPVDIDDVAINTVGRIGPIDSVSPEVPKKLRIFNL